MVLLTLLLPLAVVSVQSTSRAADADPPDAATAAAVAAASAVAVAEAERATKSPDRNFRDTSNTLSQLAKCVKSHPCGIRVFLIALVIVLGATAIVLVRAATAQKDSADKESVSISTLPTAFFFWLGISYLLLLLLIGMFYAIQSGSARPYMIGGLLPIAVPWFGALGAVTISLAGVFFYSDEGWKNKYNYWHIGRPLFGAVLGVVAYFIFILILGSAGTAIAIFADFKPKARDYIIYYVLAFLVGYREETFRELIQRATDLILKPGATPAVAGSPSVSFKKGGGVITKANLSQQTVGSAATWTIEIDNVGDATLKSPAVALENGSATEFTLGNNQLAGITELKPEEGKSVDVTFLPTAGKNSYTGALIVTGSNISRAARLPLTGSS